MAATATGVRAGEEVEARVTLAHEDMYAATAIPLVAVRQWCEERLARSGVQFMGAAVATSSYTDDLRELGMTAEVSVPSPGEAPA